MPVTPCGEPGCPYTSKCGEALESHRRKHRGERPLACRTPGCAFATHSRGSLRMHEKLHELKHPFSCPSPGCGFTALGNNAFSRHLRGHNADPAGKFLCPVPRCGYTSKHSCSMKVHALSLHGEDGKASTFICKRCGAILESREAHASHLAGHKTEAMCAGRAAQRAAQRAAAAVQAIDFI